MGKQGNFQHFSFYEQLKFQAQLSMKKVKPRSKVDYNEEADLFYYAYCVRVLVKLRNEIDARTFKAQLISGST